MQIREKYVLPWRGLAKNIANRDFGPNGLLVRLQCHCLDYDAMFGADSLLIILYHNDRVFSMFTMPCIDRMVRPLLFLTFRGP